MGLVRDRTNLKPIKYKDVKSKVTKVFSETQITFILFSTETSPLFVVYSSVANKASALVLGSLSAKQKGTEMKKQTKK